MQCPIISKTALLTGALYVLLFQGCSGCEHETGLSGDAHGDGVQEIEISSDGADLDWEVSDDGTVPDQPADLDGGESSDSIDDEGSGENPCCAVIEEPVVVAEPGHVVDMPIVQWTGNLYGMLWSDSTSSSPAQVSFRTMTADGNLSPETREYNPFPDRSPYAADIAWSGSLFGVPMSLHPAPYRMAMIFLTEGGDWLGTSPEVDLPAPRGHGCNTDWDGETFGVTCLAAFAPDGSSAVYYSRFGEDRSLVLAPDPVTYSSNDLLVFWTPEILWMGDRYIVAYPSEERDAFAITMDADGRLMDGPGGITEYLSDEVFLHGCADPFGAGFLVHCNTEYRDLLFARVDRETRTAFTDRVFAHSDPTSTSVACSGEEYGICWCDGGKPWFGRIDVNGSRIGENIAVRDETVECHGCYTVWSVSEYGMVFSAMDPDDAYRIYAVRIRPLP